MPKRQGEVDVQLLEEQLAEGAAVAEVDPVADGRVLLLALALARDDIVVALGAGYGARQPDLLVGGLLVDHVGAEVGEAEGQDAGLKSVVVRRIGEIRCDWNMRGLECSWGEGLRTEYSTSMASFLSASPSSSETMTSRYASETS